MKLLNVVMSALLVASVSCGKSDEKKSKSDAFKRGTTSAKADPLLFGSWQAQNLALDGGGTASLDMTLEKGAMFIRMDCDHESFDSKITLYAQTGADFNEDVIVTLQNIDEKRMKGNEGCHMKIPAATWKYAVTKTHLYLYNEAGGQRLILSRKNAKTFSNIERAVGVASMISAE